jgi:hypothetical protein
VTGLAATCVAASAKWSWAAEIGGGPSFSADGPDAELYGAGENYPIKDGSRIYQPGNPASPKYRVGAFSHYDEIFPTRQVDRAATAWPFKRTPADVSYEYKGNRASLADYLARNPVTGLLIAKDDRILVERYQYGRTDRDRLMSQSMAKSITGMMIGIATAEGAIKSIDDAAETYVPGLKGTEYGATPIKKAPLPASRSSTNVSRRRGRASVTPASRRTCLVSCWTTRPVNQCAAISRKKSGSRSALKPMPNG